MLKEMMDENEKILWSGKPDFFLYVFGNGSAYLSAIVWGIFAYLVLNQFYFMDVGSMQGSPVFLFRWIYILPIGILLLVSIVRAITYHTVEYAITDKRSYISSGIFGTDVTIIEHRSVEKLTVHVNPLEHLKRVGTIQLTPDTVERNRNRSTTIKGHRFLSIQEPYKVYKMLKKIVLDVATDQQFPNAYRPSENSGYDTELKD